MSCLERLRELKDRLLKSIGFDADRIWIGCNKYGEYEVKTDDKPWSSCYSYREAESAIYNLFKGIKMGMRARTMKKITVRIEIYDDMEISDFEQALLETGLASIDCSYEIIEN